MEEFSEEDLAQLINEALSEEKSSHPFGGISTYLGLAETDLLESLHERLSKRFVGTYVNDIFQDLRGDILSRKISTNLQQLHTVTRNCRKCSIDSNAELPKWNTESPDIVIVVDSPSLSSDAISLMVESFKKVGFHSGQMCLTYVNRCPVKRKYENNEVINCSPYLHLEIQILNPKIVLCMGATPASVIFGTDIKIKDVRGKINWLGYWPILTTYSPNFVIKQNSLGIEHIIDHFESDLLQAYNFAINV
jgi:uracil-DNA glycosylase family 4